MELTADTVAVHLRRTPDGDDRLLDRVDDTGRSSGSRSTSAAAARRNDRTRPVVHAWSCERSDTTTAASHVEIGTDATRPIEPTRARTTSVATSSRVTRLPTC
jgi:hypothetical protein